MICALGGVPVSVVMTVAISIAISFGVVVVIAGIFGSVESVVLAVLDGIQRDVVDDDAGYIGPYVAQNVTGADQRLAPGLLGARDEDDHIGDLRTDHSVSDGENRWRVNHNVAELFTPTLQKLRHGIRGEHFRWIGRRVPSGDYVQSGNLLDGFNRFFRGLGS